MTSVSPSETLNAPGDSLRHHVLQVSRHARRLMWQRGFAWTLATVCVVTTLAIAVDWWLRLDDVGMRVLLTVVVGAIVSAAGSRWLWPRPLSVLEVARHIEGRFPQLRDRLTSALEFHESVGRCNSGAAPLQVAVIQHAWTDASELDFQQCLDSRPARRAIVGCCAALAIAGGIVCANPMEASRGVQRLLMPWAGPQWPRENQLRYIDPPGNVMQGESVSIRVEDQNRRLDGAGTLELWFDGDPLADVERQVMELREHELTALIANVERPLQYRVLAGDDQLPWRRLQVTEPAKVEAWSMRATMPAYTGGAAVEVRERAHVLVGSRLELTGRVSRPMKAGWLMASNGERWMLRLTGDQRSFELMEPLHLDTPGVFELWVECHEGLAERRTVGDHKQPDHSKASSRTGFTSRIGPQVEIQVAADAPPAIAWPLPKDGRLAAPNSQLPLEAVVKDNADVRIVDCVVDHAGVQRTLALHRGAGDRSVIISQRLPLVDWGLRPGDEFQMQLAAEDSQPGSTRRSESPWRRIRIVSLDELASQNAIRQAAIFQRLEQLLDMQRTTGNRTQELHRELRRDSEADRDLDPERRETLQGVELEQRRVLQSLGSRRVESPSGVTGLVRELSAELSLTPDFDDERQRLQTLQDTLENVVGPYADDVQRNLVAAVQFGKVGGPADESTERVEAAAIAQSGVVQTLERLLADARQWTNFQQAAQELSRLIEQQQRLGEEIEESLFLQLASPADERLSTMAVEHATQQQTLGRQFDKLLANLQRLFSQGEHPLAPSEQAAIQRAIEHAQGSGISSLFREIAQQLRREQWGPSVDDHQRLLQRLREVLAALQVDPANVPERPEAIAEKLEQWIDAARRLARDWEQPLSTDFMRRQQAAQSLADAAGQAADMLEQDYRAAAEQAGMASIMMSRAAEADIPAAERARSAAAAARQMASAVQALKARRVDAADALQTWQATVAGMVERQQLLLESLDLLIKQGAVAFEELEQKQRALRKELAIAGDGSGSAILNASLFRAAPAMDAAAVELGLGNGESAATAMRVAVRLLRQLGDALESPTSDPAEPAGSSDPQRPSPASEQPPGASSLKLPELKMLLAMQQGIATRTIELEQLKQSRPLRPGELDEQRELSEQQGRLAEWLQGLSELGNPGDERPMVEPKSVTPADPQAVEAAPSAIDSLMDRFQEQKRE